MTSSLRSVPLSLVAALALLFCSDVVIWHALPLGYEGRLAYGGLAFLFGTLLSVIALTLTITALRRTKSKPLLTLRVCSIAVLIAFVVLALIDILQSAMAANSPTI